MRIRSISVALLSSASILVGFEARGASPDSFGKIDFPVTGGEPAKTEFLRGILALHSFIYDDAKEAFQASVKAEPGFAMGYFGLALASSKLLWRDDDLAAGRAALAKLPPLDRLTPRERAYIDTVRQLMGEGDLRTRRIAFARALENMHRDYPDDDEAKAFLALAIISALDDQESLEVGPRARAAALAFEIQAKNSDHPGAAHYIIHALDTPELAPLALASAKRYAAIAPAAFHARHMPAHTFTRLGMWREGLTSCESAWDVSVERAKAKKLGFEKRDTHSLGWIIEINFELGRRAAAEKAFAVLADALKETSDSRVRSAYAWEARSYLDRTGDWSRAEQLLGPLSAGPAPAPASKPMAAVAAPSSAGGDCGAHLSAKGSTDAPPWELYTAHNIAFIRARAAAERQDIAATRRYLDDSKRVEKQLAPRVEALMGKAAKAKEVDATQLFRNALTAIARRDDRALEITLRKQAAIEDRLPLPDGAAQGWVTREQLGEVLFRLGRAADAAKEFEAVLKQHANRTRSLLGLARAKEKAGDRVAARRDYETLAAIWTQADEGTPGLAEVRSHVASTAAR